MVKLIPKIPKISLNGINPVALFFSNNAKAARFLFYLSAALLVLLIAEPIYFNMSYQKKQKVIIVDSTGTFYVAPMVGVEEAGQMFKVISNYATDAFLSRNPNGVDNPQLLKQMYINPALGEIKSMINKEKDTFQARQIHQKVEIKKIKVLEVSTDQAVTIVKGQLIRVGKYQGQTYQEGYNFILQLVLAKNPQLGNKGNMRLPYAVWKMSFFKEPIKTKTNTYERGEQ